MGQDEVIKLLMKKNKPLTSSEISELLDIGMRSVRRSLSQLKKDSSVKLDCKKLSKEEILKRYGKHTNSPNLQVYFLKQIY